MSLFVVDHVVATAEKQVVASKQPVVTSKPLVVASKQPVVTSTHEVVGDRLGNQKGRMGRRI